MAKPRIKRKTADPIAAVTTALAGVQVDCHDRTPNHGPRHDNGGDGRIKVIDDLAAECDWTKGRSWHRVR